MEYNCKFCSDTDIERCVPGLSVDLQSAIDSGVVLDTGTVEQFNDIEDSTSVHCRVTDVFQALELQKAYLSKGRINNSSSLAGSQENPSTSSSSGTATAGE